MGNAGPEGVSFTHPQNKGRFPLVECSFEMTQPELTECETRIINMLLEFVFFLFIDEQTT
jgi:hypothetical protein